MLPQVVRFQVPPFESLVVQFYHQLQTFLANCLRIQKKFILLLVGALSDIMRTHLRSCVGLGAST
jgi:hypothetical protein